jgi:prophage maintenance system killer protein
MQICCYRGSMTLKIKEISPLPVGDMLLIAQRELKRPAEELKDMIDLRRAIAALHAPFPRSGEIDLYPHPIEKAAICCSRIVRADLFPDANKKIAFECMCEMLATAEYPWSWNPKEAEEIEEQMNQLKAEEITEAEFIDWVWKRLKA